MTDPADEPNDRPDEAVDEPPLPDDEELAAAFIAAEDAEDDGSSLTGSAYQEFHAERLRARRDQLELYLLTGPKRWLRWSTVVEAIEGRPLADISPRNARLRAAAWQLKDEGLAELDLSGLTPLRAIRRTDNEGAA